MASCTSRKWQQRLKVEVCTSLQDAMDLADFINTRPCRCHRIVTVTCNGLNIHESPFSTSKVCWLSHGKILKRPVRLADESSFFSFYTKCKYQIWTCDNKWLSVAYCLADIFGIVNTPDLSLWSKWDVLTK